MRVFISWVFWGLHKIECINCFKECLDYNIFSETINCYYYPFLRLFVFPECSCSTVLCSTTLLEIWPSAWVRAIHESMKFMGACDSWAHVNHESVQFMNVCESWAYVNHEPMMINDLMQIFLSYSRARLLFWIALVFTFLNGFISILFSCYCIYPFYLKLWALDSQNKN